MDWSEVATCMDLSEAHIERATRSREEMHGLLVRFSEIAEPETGAAKILLALARLATAQANWIEGDVRIEIAGEAEAKTSISVIADLGGGVREKVFATVRLRVDVDEFTRAVTIMPRLVKPLEPDFRSDRLVLVAPSDSRRRSMPPPLFEISDESLRMSLFPPPRMLVAAMQPIIMPLQASVFERATVRPAPTVLDTVTVRPPAASDEDEPAPPTLRKKAPSTPSEK